MKTRLGGLRPSCDAWWLRCSVVRALVCVVLVLGVSACDATSSSQIEMPSHFATPANAKLVGTAVPLLTGPGPGSDAHFAPGWFAFLHVSARPRDAYRTLRHSAKRHGVTLPTAPTACRRLPVPDQPEFRALEPGVPVTATTTTPVAPGPPARLGPTLCSGEATSSDGHTYVSVTPTSCAVRKCKGNEYMVVAFRSTRVQRAPTLVPEDPTTRLTSDEASGTRLLAAFDMCNGGGSAIREVLADPDKYWEGLKVAVNSSSTARMSFQGRSVRLRFTSSFGDDASYALTSGHGLAHPVVAIQHCG